MAACGPERGRDATAEALAWAWEHQDRLADLKDPVAFLYRVGQSRSRSRRRIWVLPASTSWSEPWIEPALGKALKELSDHQRICVILVHSFSWTLSEVADLFGIKVTTVQSHLDRGLNRLRRTLEVCSQ